jgi:hypothetical protein
MMSFIDTATPKLLAQKSETTKFAELAVKAGAMVIVNEAKKRSPYLTGTLRSALHAEPVTIKSNMISARIGTSKVVYARRQEYEHKTKAGFLRGSLHDKGREAARVIKNILKAGT